MPHQKAAFKSLRKSAKQAERNYRIRKRIRDIRKKADRALQRSEIDAARGFYQQLQKAVDKASKVRGFMKQNTAARYKSQLAKKILRVAAAVKKA